MGRVIGTIHSQLVVGRFAKGSKPLRQNPHGEEAR